MKTLVNKIVRITSDNENYIDWVGRDLVITHSSNKGMGYDSSMLLCDLMDADSGEFYPFSLYEYEFEVIR